MGIQVNVITGEVTEVIDDVIFTPETNEQASARVRAKRDSLLSASDWTQVADAPVDKEAWATYRQELRDLPTQVGFPFLVVYPNKPN